MNRQMSISKVNIFTGNIAHPLVNLLMQHRRSSGNSAYSFLPFAETWRKSFVFFFTAREASEWTNRKLTSLILLLQLSRDKGAYCRSWFRSNGILPSCPTRHNICVEKLPPKFERCCILTIVQTCRFIRAEIADI